MYQNKLKIFIIFFIFSFFKINFLSAEILKKIEIFGNDRISSETIILFTETNLEEKLNEDDLNLILKKLYKTNFFKNIDLSFSNNILKINVLENSIIENIIYEGIKTKKLLSDIKNNSFVRSRSSFSEFLLQEEKKRIQKLLLNKGYYTSKVDVYVEQKLNNLVDVKFEFDLGSRAKVKKISFVGNKVFKDTKLRRIIASTEYKHWKFLSGRKYLNQDMVNFDERLLTNFYKNNGYYNVKINSSFAKMINENEFELIYNINSNEKFFFGDLSLDLPVDFNKENFNEINKVFKDLKNEKYSIISINKILEQIDMITLQEQYQFINATVDEVLVGNKINLNFTITEGEKFFVDKINIFGNTITSENVIRNQFELDEGDPYNELLLNKSINNLKSLNFFKTVNKKVLNVEGKKTKIIDISVDEKPTGEISASAGVGTEGGTIGFGIKENNFLGAGISLDSNFNLSSDSFKGKFSVTNPNYKNSDKSVYISAEATEVDNYKTFGYKSNKTGIAFGTDFEYRDDFYLGIGNSNFYEKIDTTSTASAQQQAQEGDYWDSFVNLDFNYDKRDQKFQTTSGFRSFYSLDLPIISDTNTLKNYYSNSYYFDLFNDNISSISWYLETANSLNNKDIKLSERITIPSKRLRGFEVGRVGPKDGNDYIGGNYAYSVNFSSNIPKLFEESQNVDFLFFADVADIWGVDYDSSLDKSKIRSSIGLGLDWYSPLGPMTFSLASPITKADSDRTESFRFNLGTTF